MRIRYAVTHVASDGLRQLTFPNWADQHYDTPKAAKAGLKLYEPQLRAKLLGDRADTLEVRPIVCWDHGESSHTVFSD